MKKVFVSAMAIATTVVYATLSSCTAQTSTPKANLKTDIDSLSYAFGVTQTQGLEGYLTQMGIDSTHMDEFLKGLNEGFSIDKNDKKRLAHMVGIQVGQQVGTQMLPQIESNIFQGDSTQSLSKDNFIAGFIAGTKKKDILIPETEAQTYVQTKAMEVQAKAMEVKYAERKAADLKYLEDNKKNEGVIETTSGLQYKVVKEGNGPKPTANDVVKVNYIGTLVNGQEFDSSVKRGQPAEFMLSQVIPGWTEGIQLMSIGSKYIFYIPYNLAYGEQGRPGSIDPFSTLIFEVELLDIVKQ